MKHESISTQTNRKKPIQQTKIQLTHQPRFFQLPPPIQLFAYSKAKKSSMTMITKPITKSYFQSAKQRQKKQKNRNSSNKDRAFSTSPPTKTCHNQNPETKSPYHRKINKIRTFLPQSSPKTTKQSSQDTAGKETLRSTEEEGEDLGVVRRNSTRRGRKEGVEGRRRLLLVQPSFLPSPPQIYKETKNLFIYFLFFGVYNLN